VKRSGPRRSLRTCPFHALLRSICSSKGRVLGVRNLWRSL
jgi:hypothetical protein